MQRTRSGSPVPARVFYCPLLSRLAPLVIALLLLQTLGWRNAPPAAPEGPSQRWIVQLESAPLAGVWDKLEGRSGLASIAPSRRLSADSYSSRIYLERIAAEQQRFVAAIAEAVPSAIAERRYGTVLNGLAVRLPASEVPRLRDLPGVASIAPDRAYRQQVYPDVEQMGATALWEQAGGPGTAGAGVKIAIVDSGIYLPNPSFNPAGFSYPEGFPKGDSRYTTPKVIVARNYIRADDPAKPGEDTPLPKSGGHGSHVAATSGGNAGVEATIEGLRVPVSGVAPATYLMNYRVFYPSNSSSDFVSENAFTAELVAALEDVVKDGADVVNNSWGSSYNATDGWPDPMVQAIEATVAAGVVVSQAAGNDGPGIASANNPANAPSAITVGAVTTTSEVARNLVVSAGAPPDLERLQFSRASFGPRLTVATAAMPASIVDSLAANGACAALPDGSLDGRLAIVSRGVCSFVQKTQNAQSAGAAAVLFVSDSENRFAPNAGGPANDIRVPAGLIAKSDGARLTAWLAANPSQTIRLDPGSAIVNTQPDRLAQFSGKGPTVDQTLKPDVVAPGVNILAAGYGPDPNPLAGFGQISGTSMAAPHVTGAVALLRQAHPDWTPARIKSAIMATANPKVTDQEGRPLATFERGSGRVDLVRAVSPAATFDPPSISFGDLKAGAGARKTLKVASGGQASFQSSVSLFPDPGAGVAFTVTPASFSIGPGETVQLELSLTLGPDAAAGDYGGDLVLDGATGPVRLPFWARVVPERDRDFLLIDDDGSEDGSQPQTAGVYRLTLESLGVPYDILDADEERPRGDQPGSLPPVAALQRYKAVILTTGSRTSPATKAGRISLNLRDQQALADYLNGGGRIIAMGRNVASVTDVNFSFEDPLFGRSRLFHGYFGAVVRGETPAPATVKGADGTPLAGKSFNLQAAGNLPILDAYREDSDTYLAAETVRPALVAGETMALFRESQPTAAEPRKKFEYRSALLAFGLEDVVEADRGPLLKGLLDWLTR